jgi:hypothetical protein
MPTNANTFNSRVTSEALEAKYRTVFPAQGGAELVQDLFASGVIQPVVDFSSVAEGSVLSENLQTAWDFSTGYTQTINATRTLITNTGFWKVDLTCTLQAGGVAKPARVFIDDGATRKDVWHLETAISANNAVTLAENVFIVFLRAGDSLKATSSHTDTVIDIWYRQIADVNGNLVNPLGFTFS